MSEITKWYQGKNIFITGGTGFVGKCLVEKLLRDCPDTGYIYLMIRPKKGVSFDQRKLNYSNHVVFSHLKENKSHVFEKLRFIEGDLRAPDLGISDVDKKLVAETVSVIFHSAADVRFDQPLVDAYNSNVKGTEGLLKFATQFKHIDAVVVVSTTFSQPNDIGKLKERHYPSIIEPELMKRFVNNIDPDILNILSPKLLGKHPNTYGFTKSISEQLVYDYKDKFPTAIARPAIIVMAWKEPHVGYTEGMHSINGWYLASGRGVLRSMQCRENYPCNVIPNDIVVNGIIVLAYECGKQNQNRLQSTNQVATFHNSEASNNSTQTIAQTNEPLYFNIAEEKPMSWKQYVDAGQPNYFRTPFNYALWFPGGSFKTNRLHHFICVVLFQLLPAILVDTLLVIFRRPPILMKVQRKIAFSCETLAYYTLNLFVFQTEVYSAAVGRLNEIDKQIFYDKSRMITLEYFRGAAVGARVYLVKEKPEDIPKARRTFRRLFYLDLATKTLFTYWIIQKVFSHFELSVY